jgi:hypothetical protein
MLTGAIREQKKAPGKLKTSGVFYLLDQKYFFVTLGIQTYFPSLKLRFVILMKDAIYNTGTAT